MKTKGFTLIELLIVIGIIIILSVSVFILLDPAEKFARARNARRWSDVDTIINAVKHYQVDHDGELPEDFPTQITYIGDGTNGTYNLGYYLIDNRNLAKMPYDPREGSYQNTCYWIKNDRGIIWVRAACAERMSTGEYIEMVW